MGFFDDLAKAFGGSSKPKSSVNQRRDGPMADSSKSGLKKITDDIQMDLGFKAPDEDYEARLPERKARSMAAMKAMQKSDNDKPKSILTKEVEKVKKKEETKKVDDTTKKEDDTTKLITKDLDLKAVDDTDESKAATEKVNEKFTDAAVANEKAFGGDDVFDVVQDDSSFISPELKALQEQVAALQAKLDDNSGGTDSPGGASSIINQPGSNQSANNSGDGLSQVSVAAQNLNSSSAKGGVMEAAAAAPTSSGASEDKAIEMYKKGRRSTILTGPGGLLNDDKDAEEDGVVRRRRGLIA